MQKHCPSSCDFCYGKTATVQVGREGVFSLSHRSEGAAVIHLRMRSTPSQRFQTNKKNTVLRSRSTSVAAGGLKWTFCVRLRQNRVRGPRLRNTKRLLLLCCCFARFSTGSKRGGQSEEEAGGYDSLARSNLFLIVDWETPYGCGKFLSPLQTAGISDCGSRVRDTAGQFAFLFH